MDILQHLEEQQNLLKIRTNSLNSFYLQAKDTFSSVITLCEEISSFKFSTLNLTSLPNINLDSIDDLSFLFQDFIDSLNESLYELKTLLTVLSKEVYVEPHSD
jgi:hypothetical protein